MKKFSIICFSFLICVCNLFAKDIDSISIEATSERLSKGEANSICQLVTDKLSENLSKYTDFNIVNTVNKNQILESQRENEDIIEVGKLVQYSHKIFLKITKAKSRYIISLKLTDLTTGLDDASVTSEGRKDVDQLYLGHGCAVDELTIKLCDSLGIELSDLNRRIIMEGFDNLTDAEKNIVYDSDIDLYNRRIKALNAELAALENATTLEEKAEKQALIGKKAKAEASLKTAAARKERAELEEKMRKEDELKNKNRSKEQQNRINSRTDDIQNKIEELRNKKQEEISLLKQISIIEKKKEYYLETKDNVEKELARMAEDIAEKKQSIISEVDSREFQIAEMSKGKPTEQAIANREREKNNRIEKIDKKDGAEMKEFREEWNKELSNMLREINADYRNMKPKMISTLNNELIIGYGTYDGEKAGWPLSVSVQIDDELLLETTSFLPFTAVTGQKVVKEFNPELPDEYNDFKDTVDFYESLFSNGDQILTFTLDYAVSQSERPYPSKYDITFSNFCFYDTEDMKIRGNKVSSKPAAILKLEDKSVSKQLYPIHDIRTPKQIEEDEAILAKRRKAIADEEARKQKAIADEAAAQEKKIKDQQKKEELQELKRQQNEEKAKAREEKVAEMKDDIGTFFDDVGEKVGEAVDYHSANADTSIASMKFEAVGGGIMGAGFELNYTYDFNEHFFLGTSLDLIFAGNSTYYGLKDTNTGVVVNDLIEVGYRHSLNSLIDYVFDTCSDDWDVFSCPDLYYLVGLGWNVCNPKETPTSGSFVLGLQIGIDSTILDTVTIISETELNFMFGYQKTTGYGATACINFDIGAGYRF